MRERILAVIEKNSRISVKELADLLGENEAAVAAEIAEMENEHIICGYHTLINWDKTRCGEGHRTDRGKGNAAARDWALTRLPSESISYPRGRLSVYLISGGYDFTGYDRGERPCAQCGTVRGREACPPSESVLKYRDPFHSEKIQRPWYRSLRTVRPRMKGC